MYHYNQFTNPLIVLGIILAGVFSWTLFEYVFHRFISHGEDMWMPLFKHNKWVYTTHFMMHGIHHAFP